MLDVLSQHARRRAALYSARASEGRRTRTGAHRHGPCGTVSGMGPVFGSGRAVPEASTPGPCPAMSARRGARVHTGAQTAGLSEARLVLSHVQHGPPQWQVVAGVLSTIPQRAVTAQCPVTSSASPSVQPSAGCYSCRSTAHRHRASVSSLATVNLNAQSVARQPAQLSAGRSPSQCALLHLLGTTAPGLASAVGRSDSHRAAVPVVLDVSHRRYSRHTQSVGTRRDPKGFEKCSAAPA